MRQTAKLLLISALVACGAPGSDSVFTRGNPKTESLDSLELTRAKASPQTLATKLYMGYYRKVGDDSQFQPCGTSVPLEITGSPVARGILKERFRWNAVWEGSKMYGVFQGAIVIDTPDVGGVTGDSVKAGPRTRFFLIGVDSLRTWQARDCGGMRIPSERRER